MAGALRVRIPYARTLAVVDGCHIGGTVAQGPAQAGAQGMTFPYSRGTPYVAARLDRGIPFASPDATPDPRYR
jgi:hypothetical protein